MGDNSEAIERIRKVAHDIVDDPETRKSVYEEAKERSRKQQQMTYKKLFR